MKKVIGTPSIMAQVAKFLVPKRVGAVEQVSTALWCSCGTTTVWNTVRSTLNTTIQDVLKGGSLIGILANGADGGSFWAAAPDGWRFSGMNVNYLCSQLRELGYDRWVEHFVGLWEAQVSSDKLSDIMMMQIGEDRVWSMMVQDCRAASSLFLSLVKGMLPHAGAKGTLRYLSDIINGRCIAISPNIEELFDVEKFIRELQIGYDARMFWSSLQDEEDDSMDDDEEDSDDDDPADDAEDDSTDDDEEDLDDDDTADDAEDEHAPNEDEEDVWNALLALGRNARSSGTGTGLFSSVRTSTGLFPSITSIDPLRDGHNHLKISACELCQSERRGDQH